MLWYKSWLETRTRFFIALLGISALCLIRVYIGEIDVFTRLPLLRTVEYRTVLDEGHSMLCFLWMMGVILLTMGGLLREKATGAAPFTLALPVGRPRLLGTRIGMCLAEAVVLAIVPWIVMFLTASVFGEAVSLDQAGFLLALLLSGGMVFFGVALLVSSLVEGEYTAPMVSFGVVFAGLMALNSMSLDKYSPMHFASGGGLIDRHTGLVVGPIPWVHAVEWILLTVFLVAISLFAIQCHEF
ncbi:MAG: hypothetical protein KGL59_07000 [Acidobacteriota bacterium]|nr:hypothetical protein [Acidobacteriota bacterium]